MQYKKEEVRNRIIRAAKREFKKSGYFRAKMLQISNKSRVPIGNLYKYFPSKEKLFEAIVSDANKNSYLIIDYFSKSHEVGMLGNIRDEIEIVSYVIVEFISRHKDEFLLLLESSYGSSFEGFQESLMRKVEMILPMYESSRDNSDKLITKVIAQSLIEGLLIIIKKSPTHELYSQICNFLSFFFREGKYERKDYDVIPSHLLNRLKEFESLINNQTDK